MKTKDDIKQSFQSLPLEEQERLLEDLKSSLELCNAPFSLALGGLHAKGEKCPCPHCGSAEVIRSGKPRGIQYYRCRLCSKTYTELYGTPLWDIKKKHKWAAYIRCMQEGLSLRKIAKELSISERTAFDWRHKIFACLSPLKPQGLSGILEFDEKELPINEKGRIDLRRVPRRRSSDFSRNAESESPTVVQVASIAQRSGGCYLEAVPCQRLSAGQIEEVAADVIAPGATVITDKHPSYKAYAKTHPEINHRTVLASDKVDKKDRAIHLQNVNSLHSRLGDFLHKYHGVATKYLQGYLNFFAFASEINNTNKPIQNWFDIIISSRSAYASFWETRNKDSIIAA